MKGGGAYLPIVRIRRFSFSAIAALETAVSFWVSLVTQTTMLVAIIDNEMKKYFMSTMITYFFERLLKTLYIHWNERFTFAHLLVLIHYLFSILFQYMPFEQIFSNEELLCKKENVTNVCFDWFIALYDVPTTNMVRLIMKLFVQQPRSVFHKRGLLCHQASTLSSWCF